MGRKEVLLRAALEILKKADEGPFVKDVLAETVHYDGTECDGACLMEDIENELEFSVFTEVDVREYEQLKDDSRFLECLNAAGVDNWDGYSYAFSMFHNEEED